MFCSMQRKVECSDQYNKHLKVKMLFSNNMFSYFLSFFLLLLVFIYKFKKK